MTFEKYIIIKYEKLIFCGISIFEGCRQNLGLAHGLAHGLPYGPPYGPPYGLPQNLKNK